MNDSQSLFLGKSVEGLRLSAGQAEVAYFNMT
jgi:hypothetical protein